MTSWFTPKWSRNLNPKVHGVQRMKSHLMERSRRTTRCSGRPWHQGETSKVFWRFGHRSVSLTFVRSRGFSSTGKRNQSTCRAEIRKRWKFRWVLRNTGVVFIYSPVDSEIRSPLNLNNQMNLNRMTEECNCGWVRLYLDPAEGINQVTIRSWINSQLKICHSSWT